MRRRGGVTVPALLTYPCVACPGYKIFCCGMCCGAEPLHPSQIEQRPGGMVGLVEQFSGAHFMETVRFNLWAPNALPAQVRCYLAA